MVIMMYRTINQERKLVKLEAGASIIADGGNNAAWGRLGADLVWQRGVMNVLSMAVEKRGNNADNK